MRIAALLLLALAGGAGDLIDRRVAERWESERAAPAARADDYEFFRRLSLDLRGVIPQPAEVRAFAADRDAAKREKTVDAWLRGEEFAAWWAKRWWEELTINPTAKIQDVHDAFRGWLRDAVRANIPYDRFARRLLTARGPTDLDPAAGFLVASLWYNKDGPLDVAERAARVFLGTQIRCAECHDHPFDTWTQQEFYGMVSFFWQAQAQVAQNPAMMSMGTAAPYSVGSLREDPARGEPAPPAAEKVDKTDKALKTAKKPDAPKSAHGPTYKSSGEGPAAGEPRRAAFARLLLADRQFARAAVNRHWGMIMGRGFVHPLDGFNAARKPSHPELLDELADEFVRTGYDARKLIRAIVLSRPYQLSSRSESPTPDRLFARAAVAPLLPEQLFSSIVRATGLEAVPANPKGGKDASPLKALRDAFNRDFQPATGVNEPVSPGTAEPTIPQALFFMNGELVARGVAPDPGLRLGKLLASERDPSRRIEELFLATLSRPPTKREAEALLAKVRKAGDSDTAYENVFWALMNSSEFVTRH